MTVAPLTGAWIETAYLYSSGRTEQVAPLTGAWIALSNRKQYGTTGKDMGEQQKYRQLTF